MKLITQTEKKQYHAVEVPMDAVRINMVGSDVLTYFIGDYFQYWNKNSFDFEIIGIQGGGESLSEEQAIEVLYHNDLQAYEYDGSEALQFLKVVLKDLGIETENPYKKPERRYLESAFSMTYEEKLKVWELENSNLKKVVIIRSEI